MSRLVTIISSLLLLAAVGVGVAVADSGYQAAQKKQPKISRGKLAKLKDFEESQTAVTAYLTGKAVVNDEGQDGAGDPGAKGTATFFIVDRQTICYGFALRGAEAPNFAAIYRAPAGQKGEVVIDFTKGVPKDPNGQPAGDPGASSGCKVVTGSEQAALLRILSNAKGYYVSMKTASFGGGAVRGQLSRMLYDND
jgi:hypothetical protein